MNTVTLPSKISFESYVDTVEGAVAMAENLLSSQEVEEVRFHREREDLYRVSYTLKKGDQRHE